MIFRSLGEYPGSRHWIGLSDELKEYDWRWTDGSRVNLAEVGFLKYEPNGLRRENCAVTNNAEADLNDVPCHYKYPFICEIKVC